LESFISELTRRIAALQSCGVPETLLHGDFHPGNVALGDDGMLVIFDWTDTSVGHPFFDLATYMMDETDVSATTSATLVDAYASEWRAALSYADVDEALRLAAPLAQLHHAISYFRLIEAIDNSARWELGGAEGGWLRRLLAMLDS
jgi:aminoglycoside phosphotransferase (APT) family kinase protein